MSGAGCRVGVDETLGHCCGQEHIVQGQITSSWPRKENPGHSRQFAVGVSGRESLLRTAHRALTDRRM